MPLTFDDSPTMDINIRTEFSEHHYALNVSVADFDAIFARIRTENIPYDSGSGSLENGESITGVAGWAFTGAITMGTYRSC